MATTLTQTTLSGAISSGAKFITVASVTNISAPVNNFKQQIYVINPGSTKGELMTVLAVSGTQVQVERLSLFREAFLTGAIVIIDPLNPSVGLSGFTARDPTPVPATAPVLTWIVNVTNGNQWLYSTVSASWVPGFNNTTAPLAPTAAVASAAGVVLPTGPLFHITGALAITGFTRPSGFTSGSFTAIADGAFTWTTGDSSIAVAGAATTVGSTVTFTYDWITAKWYPSRII